MPKVRDHSIEARLYTRIRAKTSSPRYYADFRDYSHVGGKQQALKPPGSSWATTDEEEALELARRRLDELEHAVEAVPADSIPSARALGPYVEQHLRKLAKAKLKEVEEAAERIGKGPTKRKRKRAFQWQRARQKHLERFVRFTGEDADLALITSADIGDWVEWLQGYITAQGRTLGSGAIHQHLNTAGKLFRRAMSDGVVRSNPVAGLFERPTIQRARTPFLEVDEMGEVLRAAFEDYKPSRTDLAIPYVPEIIATLALTGCRESEVLGLLVSDVDLERGVIHIVENQYRRLKSKKARRHLLIPSQLRRVLSAYMTGPTRPTGELVFPGEDRDSREAMIQDLRTAYDRMPMPDRLSPTRWLRSKIIRHTWCAARLQTLDRGAPIAMYTVAEEMGHKDLDMIQDIYGHLGRVRHRGEEVAYPSWPHAS